jgi:hypothetical protein
MLVNADDGSVLRALSPVRTAATDPLAGVDRLRHEVVGALAARVDPRYDPGSDAHPPPSYAAYVALMRGDEAAASGASDRAVAEYRTAAAADSTYALPLLRIAMASFEGGQCGRVDSVANVLQRRGTPLSPFEGHTLERIRAFCRADWEAANDAARHMADLAPRSQRAQFAAAFSAASVNRPHEALRRLRRIDPTRGWTPPEGRYWIALAFTLHMAGDDAGLRALPGRMQGVQRDYFAVMGAAYAAAALGRTAEFERAAAELITVGRRMEATRLTILGPMLDELRAHGRPADAAAVAARLAAQVGAGVGPGAAGDTTRWAQAELLYRAGEWQAARALVAPVATRHPHIVPVVALAGRAAARTATRRPRGARSTRSAPCPIPGTEEASATGKPRSRRCSVRARRPFACCSAPSRRACRTHRTWAPHTSGTPTSTSRACSRPPPSSSCCSAGADRERRTRPARFSSVRAARCIGSPWGGSMTRSSFAVLSRASSVATCAFTESGPSCGGPPGPAGGVPRVDQKSVF